MLKYIAFLSVILYCGLIYGGNYSINTNSKPIINMKAISWIESRHNPNARGAAGELGAFQLMPNVIAKFKHKGEKWNNYNDSEAIARRYMTWISNTLKKMGDTGYNKPSHIIASYNWGIGNFQKAKFNPNRSPKTTRNYIANYEKFNTK